jgi:hypothetical protein
MRLWRFNIVFQRPNEWMAPVLRLQREAGLSYLHHPPQGFTWVGFRLAKDRFRLYLGRLGKLLITYQPDDIVEPPSEYRALAEAVWRPVPKTLLVAFGRRIHPPRSAA